jgi:hypothetical protein
MSWNMDYAIHNYLVPPLEYIKLANRGYASSRAAALRDRLAHDSSVISRFPVLAYRSQSQSRFWRRARVTGQAHGDFRFLLMFDDRELSEAL